MKYKAVVFDLFGTLLDVGSIAVSVSRFFPQKGDAVAALWRDKQIQYSQLISLSDANPAGSRHHESFWSITRKALRYSMERYGLDCPPDTEAALMGEYMRLRTYPEVTSLLQALKDRGIPVGVLSNANHEMLLSAVQNARLYFHIQTLISADTAGHFKTSPFCYELILKHYRHEPKEILFVTSNSWDVIGASWFGLDTVWVNRQGLPLETIGPSPRYTGHDLNCLTEIIDQPAS